MSIASSLPRWWWTLVWSLLVLALPARAVASPPPVVLADPQGLVVTQAVELLIEEEGAALTREQVMDPAFAARWQVHAKGRVNLVDVMRPIWIRFDLNNRRPLDAWVLGIDWPMLRCVALHQYDRDAQVWLSSANARIGRAADAQPVDGQVMDGPVYAFALDTSAGPRTTLLLRVEAMATPIVPISIRPAESWRTQRHDQAVLTGALFGVLVVMLLYNASLQLFTGDRSFSYYSVYLLGVIGYELVTTGFGPIYVWGDNDWINTYGLGASACLCFLLAALFFRHFLDLKHCGLPHLLHLNTVFIGVWSMALLWALAPLPRFFGSVVVVGVLTGLAAVYSSLRLMWRGNVPAGYFALAWAVLIVGTVATLLSMGGVIESSLFADYGQHLGFALETVLLSVALADRIRRERRARALAQEQALQLTQRLQIERDQKLLAQGEALAAQRRTNHELEQRVRARTAELERANAELGQLSITDALTQLPNRRYFDQVLAREMERSAASGEPLALLLADIDHFKAINDRHGHLAGDECLKRVAQALRTSAGRASDLVARYGGEEFALVLPATHAAQALEVAERARRAVEALAVTHRGEPVLLRLSLGVVARTAAPGQALDDFIAPADAALYRAKAAGRNRVELVGTATLAAAPR